MRDFRSIVTIEFISNGNNRINLKNRYKVFDEDIPSSGNKFFTPD